MKTLLLIDTHALVHRFYHALPPLTNPANEPTGALYGLSAILLKIIAGGNGETPPDYLAAALDRPEPTLRKQEFEAYKIQRPKAADSLIAQLKQLPEIFDHFRVRIFSISGYEADDIIGSLAERFKWTPELRIIILSGDLDTLQLVDGEKVFANIIKTGTSATVLYDEPAVVARYGLKPNQLPDFKGLVGDSSDNIPGVSGIGPKTAATVLGEFGNLEGLYENIGLVPAKIAQKLKRGKKQAFFARKLATIDRHAPVPEVALEELVRPALDRERLKSYFERQGFVSLLKRLGV